MVNFTLKNIPKNIHQYFKERAQKNHRSINREILAYLETAKEFSPIDVQQTLKDVRKFRRGIKMYLKQEELEKIIDEGRP